MGHEPSLSKDIHPWPEVNLSVTRKNDPKNADIRDLRHRRERVPGEQDALLGVGEKRTENYARTVEVLLVENLVARMQHYGYGFLTEDEARYLLRLPRLG